MQSRIEKSLPGGDISERQMERINRLTRRTLSRDEVFVFSLILCDNEIDRDGERFPRASLEALKELFLGKTGIFDHSATAVNQSARIFDTAIEELDGQAQGEARCQLRAWAYILRSDKNKELIFEIDGGIKKEVSVGCAVERIVCSICGADWKVKPCAHEKGKDYGGDICHHRLENPTDAYEWSFVAVPAQKNAGVTKRISSSGKSCAGYTELAKLFDASEEVVLSPAEINKLSAQYKELSLRAQAGDRFLRGQRGEVVKLIAITRPEISPELAEKISSSLELSELDDLCRALTKAAARVFPLSPQLSHPKSTDQHTPDNQFVI